MKIATILDQVDLGAMALPEFQRGYVWNRDQVKGLMHSLYRKHPVGSLLVWVTKTENIEARGDGELQPGTVKLLLGRHYARQITVVDVTNHGGRVTSGAPEIKIFAQVGRDRPTEIRFGRFPTEGDWVVTPAEKLANLDAYVKTNNGQLAGVNEYLDLRYDEMHVSIN